MNETLKTPEGFNPAHDAIKDAIQDTIHAFTRLTAYTRKNPNFNPTSEEILTRYLETWSYQLCHIGSRHAAEFLIKNRRDLFQGIALMESHAPRGSFAERSWNFHQVFIAKDKKDYWYIASPANYDPDPQKDRFHRILSGRDVEKVLVQLKNQDGGFWPTADLIEKTFNTHPGALPNPAPPDGFYHDGIVFQNQNTVKSERYLTGTK